MKALSYITDGFTESVIRDMTRICNAAGGYNLSQGFPDFEAPMALKEAAIKAILEDRNQYAITFGEPVLREAIAAKAFQYNKIKCNPADEVTVTCGATEAMISCLMAIINPGDEFIVFEPFYENYGPDGILSGASPRYVSLYAPDWHYDYDELSQAFNEKTKAIIINTPHNPTGKVFTNFELQQIADLCSKWDVFAVTDEIYEHILYDGSRHISIASLPGMADRTITINSISKTYSLTGWRVGWAIASRSVTERIRKVHDFLTVGAPMPLQHAAAEALRFGDEYYAELQKHYLNARDYLYESLIEAGFKPFMPAGAYYMMAETGDLQGKLGAVDDYSFSLALIDHCKVATVPASSFYSHPELGKNMIRFCFCKKWETLHSVREQLKLLAD